DRCGARRWPPRSRGRGDRAARCVHGALGARTPARGEGAVRLLRLVADATGHLVVGRAEHRAARAGGLQPDVTPSVLRMNASTSASSRHASYRPDLPPWPATISVLRSNGLVPVVSARMRATHFAGSW